ncbi:MAG: chorismate mutase [Ignavibacteria bacterium]|nr:chorismate mutase [Ignavibacteria bacterium]
MKFKNNKLSSIYQKIIGISDEITSREGPLIIAGPCTVESEEQMESIAGELSQLNIKFLRGGAFKPRTSPKSFQGLGAEGLEIMRKVADKYNMKIVSEILEPNQLDACYDLFDIIQIGSRCMMSYGLLKYVGKKTALDHKPVLLKRSYSATLNELLLAAEYITEQGNPNVILCLRGIRTFEQTDSQMRFTPDLASIPELLSMTDLPVFFDPSHATGNANFVLPISKAAINLGVDGLLVECHDNPCDALCDGFQAIHPKQVAELIGKS